MDPFAAALDALFLAPGSSAAIYHPAAGEPAPIRVIVSRPDETVSFRGSQIVQATYELSARRSEMPAPQSGETVTVEGGDYPQLTGIFTDTLRIMGDPTLDTEGLTWSFGAEPA